MKIQSTVFALILVLFGGQLMATDPCGMVPPIYTGPGSPITRIGLQQTYVFYKDGVETFVIKPGFQGNVDNFGMLIPFPTPPSLRKVPDDIFSHVANAIEPPEVVVDLRIRKFASGGTTLRAGAGIAFEAQKSKDVVRVIKKEAVGMYEVVVLEAGSADALKKWMDANGFQFPDGMDDVCNEYIDEDWCFVAVKTKVGTKGDTDPQPGKRSAENQLPSGSSFDGFVQGMGFRFETDELVVPMRLSAFNDGELRNVVYILSDEPKKIRAIPEEYVVRQVSGKSLIANVTKPLPLRIIGGEEKDIPEWRQKTLDNERDPNSKNGVAKQLFAADLLAVSSDQLSLEHEEDEKDLLAIGEQLGLRGPEIDKLNAQALQAKAEKVTKAALAELAGMTMTVVDGDFPREVLAGQNLTFAEYRMPAGRNTNRNYDPKTNAPGTKLDGKLILGQLIYPDDFQNNNEERVASNTLPQFHLKTLAMLGFSCLLALFLGFERIRFSR